MDALNQLKLLNLGYLFAGYCTVKTEWCYKDIVSAFSRIYIIDKGEAAVYMNNKKYELKQGQMFIIPKFTKHTYECKTQMSVYYIHFFYDKLEGENLFEKLQFNYQPIYTDFDLALIKRFIELNNHIFLTNLDPITYDNIDRIILNQQHKKIITTISSELESRGILMQLFSRFIINSKPESMINRDAYSRIDVVMNYICNNLDQSLKISRLAAMIYLSTDHFSRIFKTVIGISPNKFIQLKRIDHAKELIETTDLSIEQVAESIGINNLSQFSTLFLKQTGQSPLMYRKKG